MTAKISLLDELKWRGMLSQQTEGLGKALASGIVTAYCGFDPSAPSLHVGNLVPVMALAHLQRAGHRPLILSGGGTGLIGDPSGKTSERQLNTPEVVAENTKAIAGQLARFLDSDGPTGALRMDNADWLVPLSAIGFMRDIGKHFTVNYMLQKEAVKSRLDGGISYTEFSYMLLQAYDYLELHRRAGVTLQLGGSDQWGNITAGIELIRRVTGAEAHAVTVPLVTTSAGTKFGKTEAGAVWLDAARTSPYGFFQFWINVDDRDVGQFLRFFTLMSREQIGVLEEATRNTAASRAAQMALAMDVTARVHGAGSAVAARDVSALLFGDGEAGSLSRAVIEMLRKEIPFARFTGPFTPDGSADVVDLVVAAGLVKSKGEGRKLLEQGGVYVNNIRRAATERMVGTESLLEGSHVLLRKGAKTYALAHLDRS